MLDPTQPLEINDPIDEELNERQELFCQLYTRDKEYFGNGVQTYIFVYNVNPIGKSWYNVACAAASRLLSNVKVARRINELLDADGLNDVAVDAQLHFLISQHADYKSKLGAIKEYNLLKSRIVNKLDHTTLGEKLPETKTIILDTRPKEATG